MYVILVYDIGEKRVAKMLKLCRCYLNWVQNSVFEGDISEVKLKELIFKSKKIIDEKTDSIIIFKNLSGISLERQVVGHEQSSIDNFI